MSIHNDRYKVSIEFNLKPKIPTERIKEIFGLDSLTGPGYLKPQGHRRGLYFKIYEEMLWTTMAEGGPSWVKVRHITYYNIPNLIKEVVKLPTENLVITVHDAKNSIMKLILARRSNSYWEVSNGFRGATFEKGLPGLPKSEIAEMLRSYINEA